MRVRELKTYKGGDEERWKKIKMKNEAQERECVVRNARGRRKERNDKIQWTNFTELCGFSFQIVLVCQETCPP